MLKGEKGGIPPYTSRESPRLPESFFVRFPPSLSEYAGTKNALERVKQAPPWAFSDINPRASITHWTRSERPFQHRGCGILHTWG